LLRFRPIMMTTMCALVAGLPLALGHGAGSELRRPLGIAIVGGLLVSQLARRTPVDHRARGWPAAKRLATIGIPSPVLVQLSCFDRLVLMSRNVHSRWNTGSPSVKHVPWKRRPQHYDQKSWLTLVRPRMIVWHCYRPRQVPRPSRLTAVAQILQQVVPHARCFPAAAWLVAVRRQ